MLDKSSKIGLNKKFYVHLIGVNSRGEKWNMKMKKEAFLIMGIIIVLSTIYLIAALVIPIDDDSDGYNSTIDCNDSNPGIWQNMTLYADNDSDSYGAGNATIMCLGTDIPSGYSNNSLDCNDNDLAVWQTIIGYLDRDSDLYGDNNPETFCANALPYGYVNQNADCNDVNPFVHPDVTELCNSIDDNCIGGVDENYSNKGHVCYVGVGECRNSGLYVCNIDKNSTFCQGIPKSPTVEICDLKDNDCDGLTDENNICEDSNFSLVVNFPNQTTYNKNNLPINLSLVSISGKKADMISYIDNSAIRPREAVLCKSCKDYGLFSKKAVNLKDGQHDLLFKAVINGTLYMNNITVIIDGKSPRLYLPRIRSKDYTNGTFIINYDEDNLKSITLFYDNKNYTENNCSSGKKQVCKILLNLSEFQGEDILYSYLVEDIAGNKAITKNMTSEVDITPPLINELTYPVIGSYVYFRFNITEKNFKDISYFDNSYDRAKWKILCSVLKDGVCEKQQRLTPGEHNITMRISDKAGNSVYRDI